MNGISNQCGRRGLGRGSNPGVARGRGALVSWSRDRRREPPSGHLPRSDDPRRQQFSLDLTELGSRHLDNLAAEAPAREYRAQIVQARMHQARFRQAVLRAYRSCCAICRLRRGELVDAAHILGDADGGEPVVPNGMALCKLHHAAFDRHILGVRPDLTVIIRQDILDEVDGPMLLHGLQGFHDGELGVLPTRRAERPSTEFLERRWERFLAAG
jgi:putative restriction endonuclease